MTRETTPAPSRFLSRLLAGTVVVYCLHQLVYWGVIRPSGFISADYPKHWLAARCLFEGTNNYIGEHLTLVFNYPQATAFVFFWLAFFSEAMGEKIWEWTHIGFLVACWIIGWRVYLRGAGGEGALRSAIAAAPGLAAAFLVASYSPATFNIFCGNIDPYNALLGVAMAALLLHSRDRWAGVAWAMLVLCKMLPVILIVPFALWRRWRVIQGCLIVMAIYFAVLVVTGRVGYEWYFVTENVPNVSWHWLGLSLSTQRLVYYLLGQTEAPFNASWFPYIQWGVTGFFGVFYLTTVAWMKRRGVEFMRMLELTLLITPLFAPLLEPHHYVYILPVLLLHARRWLRAEMGTVWARTFAIEWILLMAYYPAIDLISPSLLVEMSPLFVNYALVATAIAEMASHPSIPIEKEAI